MFEGNVDNGADIFSFSFPGSSGKFFFDKDSSYNPVLLPYTPVKINRLGTYASTYFTMQDVSGNFYQFGKDITESTSSYNGGSGAGDHTSAWMLEKMISVDKADTISFTYHSQFDRSPVKRSDTWTVEDWVHDMDIEEVDPYNPSSTNSTSYSHNYMYSKNSQEIRFKNGKVVFELNSTARTDFGLNDSISKALKRIKVYTVTAQGEKLQKTITFFYGHLNGRLCLDSLQMLDGANTVISTYKFQYNTAVSLPALDPNTFEIDYWGYCNGKPMGIGNTTLVPQRTIDYNPFGSSGTTIQIGSELSGSRDVDTVYMQAGILKRIVFPTKGYTDFEYETNRHMDTSSNLVFAGGLRVKSIKSYDGISSTPITKTYKYGYDESGVGRANYFMSEYFFHDVQWASYYKHFNDQDYNYPYQVGTERRRRFYDNPAVDIESFDGAPVVYPMVTEYLGEGSNVLGKTVYLFRDSADVVDVLPNSSKSQLLTRYYERGQLLKKKTYKKTASGEFWPVAEERMTYNTSAYPNRIKFGGLILKQDYVTEGLPNWSPAFTDWDYYYNNYVYNTNDNYPVSSTSIVYDSGDTTRFAETVTTMEYGHFAHQQPTLIKTINSKGDTLITRTKYPSDYINSGSTTGNAVLDSMLAKNMQAAAIEKWAEIKKPSENAKVTGGQLTLFKRLSTGFMVPDKQYGLLVDAPLTDYTVGTISSGTYQKDSRYTSVNHFNVFDGRGNILEMQKADDVKESYVWSYGGAYPVAKIVGAGYDSVAPYIDTALLNHPATTELQIREQLATFRSAMTLKNVFVSTFTYKPHVGMTSQTDPRGYTTIYEYDAFGRLALVRDKDYNILKKYCYNYAGEVENCAPVCDSTAGYWVNTSTARRCQLSSGENTGLQEKEQIDLNPCSSTFKTTRWVVSGTNTTVCPLPACNYNNCGSGGPQYKCIGGVCEEGVKVYTYSYYDEVNGYVCVYHYEWSDSSWSSSYEEYNPFGYSCIIF